MTTFLPTAAETIAASRHVARAPLTWDPTDHLLSRFSFGPTPATRAFVDAQGVGGWYRSQVKAAARYRGWSGNAGVAACGPLLALAPYDLRRKLASMGNEYGWDAMDQLTQVTLGLQAWSPAQLYESLVDFFSNVLHVPNHNGDLWITRHTYDRDVIRRYATGKFSDMLLASGRHPAMLINLNLAESTKQAINENYGRELLELHTVGLRYSENDVRNCASILTGRTRDDHFDYVYDATIHPVGRIKVLGFTHANDSAGGGEAAGDALLRYLAKHPYTATNLARKLCVRFVSDTPSATLIGKVADVYLANDTAILPMIVTILHSTEFWESRGAKTRRPAENVLASLRVLQPEVDYAKATQTLHWITASLGNVPLDWPAPNGYPDVAAAWRSAGAMLQQWDLHLGFAGGWYDGLKTPDPSTYYGPAGATTSGAAIAALTERLTGNRFSAAHLATLQRFVDEPASTPLAKSRLQWLAVPVMALILDGPHHAFR